MLNNDSLHWGINATCYCKFFWLTTYALFTTPDEIEDFMDGFDIEIVEHVGTDGISQLFRRNINELNEEEYDTWIRYSVGLQNIA